MSHAVSVTAPLLLMTSTPAAIVNMPCEMLLEVVDKYGNRLDTGGATVAARALGTGASQCTAVDNNNGTYTCTFTSSVGGECRVIVRLDNTELAPITVTFEGKSGAGKAAAGEEPTEQLAAADGAEVASKAASDGGAIPELT